MAGVGFTNLSSRELLASLNQSVLAHRPSQVCFVPTNSVMAAHHNPIVHEVYASADYVICDGVPVRWASSFLGTPLKERITGFDFFPLFIQECIQKKYSVYFMGAAPGVAARLVAHYQLCFPDLVVKGFYCPPMAKAFTQEQNDSMVQAINASGADVLFVSLTAPKQDIWINQHLSKLDVKIAMGVGAAFNAVIGDIKRAPQWVQAAGLEWFYRFLQEPSRLFKRYFVEAPSFIPLVFKQWCYQKQKRTPSDVR